MSTPIINSNDEIMDKKEQQLKQELEELKKLEGEQIVAAPEFYFTEISPIHIYIQSNIPGKAPWLFKRSNLITDFERPSTARKITDYSELPYFTNEVEYPTQILYTMEPYELIDFFFSREYFEYTLHDIIFHRKLVTVEPNTTNEKRRTEYNKKNIMTMLNLLFTTVFPSTNNITNSMDEFVRQIPSPIALNRILTKNKYTYLKESNQEYTVLKIIWLNDMFNHPKYKKLASEFIKYKYWCITQSIKIQEKIDENFKKIENIIKEYDFSELLILLDQNVEKYNIPNRRVTFEQEVFETNVANFRKIIRAMDSYKRYMSNPTELKKEFLREIVTYKIDFYPKPGDTVEVNLDSFAPTPINFNITKLSQTDIDNIQKTYNAIMYAKKFWYYGKIMQKSKEEVESIETSNLFKVNLFYKEKNIQKNLIVFVDKKYLRQPILEKILEYNEIDKTNIQIQYLNDIGINFGTTKNINGKILYNNINNITTSRVIEDHPMRRNADIYNTIVININDSDFERKKNEIIKEYKQNPQYYRYKFLIPNEEETILQKIYGKTTDNPTDEFLTFLDLLEETYSRVKNNINFNSKMKGLIEGVLKLHKIILPIKTLNDLYLKKYKIDVQNKEVASGMKEYANFVNLMMDYLAPKMESSNENLQLFILSYADNVSSDNFISLMKILETCYSDKSPVCKIIKNQQTNAAIFKYINTELNYINIDDREKPQYEIYIHANLVGGHLDNSNLNKILCEYRDDELTDDFETMFQIKQDVGDWMVRPISFLSVKSDTTPSPATAKEVDIKKSKEVKSPTPQKQTIKKMRGGIRRYGKRRKTRRQK